jgi:hypothetical protein
MNGHNRAGEVCRQQVVKDFGADLVSFAARADDGDDLRRKK